VGLAVLSVVELLVSVERSLVLVENVDGIRDLVPVLVIVEECAVVERSVAVPVKVSVPVQELKAIELPVKGQSGFVGRISGSGPSHAPTPAITNA
jgi:hypothetical protein